MGPVSCVSGMRRRPGHMVKGWHDGADHLRARAAEATGAQGAMTACWRRPSNCVRMPRRRLGHMAQWRPDGVGQLRAWAVKAARAQGCSGGLMAPANCVSEAATAT
eukprot:jgi/Tetstr1/435319/TSEL_024238.t1